MTLHTQIYVASQEAMDEVAQAQKLGIEADLSDAPSDLTDATINLENISSFMRSVDEDQPGTVVFTMTGEQFATTTPYEQVQARYEAYVDSLFRITEPAL